MMEEKIDFERPRPFSSGFLIPFHRRKKHIELCIQTNKIEIFPKTLAVYILPESSYYKQIELLDSFAVELLQQHNNTWFKNDLTRDMVRDKYSRTLSSDSYMQLKCSSSHPPKKVYMDDSLQEDWVKTSKIFDREGETIETIYLTLICHGIYVQKNGFSLLWKIPKMSCYTWTDVLKDTNVDDCKEDIEAFWREEIEDYKKQVGQEIAQLEKTILAKKDRLAHFDEVLNSCKKYNSADPEWNAAIGYIQQQLFKYRTPTVS